LIREWYATREGAGGSGVATEEAIDPGQPLALQSLQAAELSLLLDAELGIEAPLETLLAGQTFAELLDALLERGGGSNADGQPDGHGAGADGNGAGEAPVEPDAAHRHVPFELTEMQRAYLVGRSDSYWLGGVSGHVYYEWSADDLDVDLLCEAFQKVVARHEMLRAVVLEDGRQRILEDVGPYEIEVIDLRGLDSAAAAEQLRYTRDRMSHQVLPADRWPLFEVRAHRLDDRRTRVHFSIDMLIADAYSIAVVLRDWARFYAEPAIELARPGVSFRDLVLARRERRATDAYQAARAYWFERLPTLPPGPQLPLRARPPSGSGRAGRPPQFARREATLEAEAWSGLKRRARRCGVTPSALLCTAYADALRRWSAEPRFTLNVTVNDRPRVGEARDLVGDFTSSLPLEVDLRDASTFREKAQRVHRRLARDLDHRLFSGVEVQRALARQAASIGPQAPVVFTSLLETPAAEALSFFDRTDYAITQTPQVFLDHQVLEREGALELVWDCVDDLFPDGLVDSMFEAYQLTLRALAEDGEPALGSAALPRRELVSRERANATHEPIPEQLLHARVDEAVARHPSGIAVSAPGRALSYAELDRRANRVARRLRELGAEPNTLVAIAMRKGWEQVVAALGIVRAGAAYLPIDADLPERRVHELLEQGEVRVALTQTGVVDRIGWPAGIERLAVDDDAVWADVDPARLDDVASPADLAYVIFTSGSTGRPKGVMIEHRAAANTIVDCIKRFRLSALDRVLALSSLSFDLSVFDVFATLSVGGTVVVPEPGAARNPARWAELVRDRGITVWNSVPALLDMLVEFADGRRERVGDSLRLAMLSGDWIAVDLPDRARTLMPALEVVSMGGATEGSIWSVLYPIGEVDPDWASIPYGKPMANQTMHVLDAELAPRPVLVPGELFIGGRGVAAGYWRDPERTAASFVEHPVTGERLYRTGDLARYLPDGNLEFLGRRDAQVKVRGYRVELGEIESVLLQHPDVEAAFVKAHGEDRGPKRLVAYCTSDRDLEACDLRRFLGDRLPEYMVPQTFVALDELPLSANGKVDRDALPAPSWDGGGAISCAAEPPPGADAPGADVEAPGTDVEATLAAIWSEVLGLPQVGRGQSFFDLGGDSLLAMRSMAKAGAAGIQIDPETFFESPTIAELAAAAVRRDPGRARESAGPLAGEHPLTPGQHWFFDQDFADPDHWNGFWPLLSVPDRPDPVLLGEALRRLMLHHDALRTRFRRDEDGRWQASIAGPAGILPVPFAAVDLSGVDDDDELQARTALRCAEAQASLSLTEGPVARLTWFDHGPDRPGRLHLAAHWAVMDYYSSRVLFEDLWTAYGQLRDGAEVALPPTTAPIGEYARRMLERAEDPDVRAELPLWTAAERREAGELPLDHELGPNDQASARQVMLLLDPDETDAVLRDLPHESGCEPIDALLAAVGRAISRWAGTDSLVVEVESHGRLTGTPGLDLSRTVGRCSAFTPYHLRVSHEQDPGESLAAVSEEVRRYASRGIGHGLLRHLGDPATREALAAMPPPSVNVNFWGHLTEYLEEAIMPFQESPGALQAARGLRPRTLDVFGMVLGGQLALVFIYSENLHRRETIERLAERTGHELLALSGRAPGGDEDALSPITVVPFEADAFVQPVSA
jgi:amino acid adenylation domain-containing protein/non-ribosomal peptide synthase protein (TIGR01720 family)